MIAVLGSINLDFITTTARLPKAGETVMGTVFSMVGGGKGANQALAARRAGASVRMAGATGVDVFAEHALALLREAGVDLASTKSVDLSTGLAQVLVDRNGENAIAVVSGANSAVSEADAVALVESMSTDDTLMLQLEIPAASVEAALSTARRRGVRTMINVAPFTPEATYLGRMADIVIANETEFGLLIGEDDLSGIDLREVMIDHCDATGQTLMVTLGAKGVAGLEGGRYHLTKALAVDVVDTIGAGDTFCGYFAAGIEARMTFPNAMRRAAAAGSLACVREGGQPAIPWATDVAQHACGEINA